MTDKGTSDWLSTSQVLHTTTTGVSIKKRALCYSVLFIALWQSGENRKYDDHVIESIEKAWWVRTQVQREWRQGYQVQ